MRNLFLLVLLGSVLGTAEEPSRWGAVFSLDLGTDSIKVAAPKYNSTIDIVLNEQSRRKSPSMIGFRKHSRYVAEEAKNLVPRFPSLMVPSPHLTAGLDPQTALRVLRYLLTFPGGASGSSGGTL
jgi:hypothetical protein